MSFCQYFCQNGVKLALAHNLNIFLSKADAKAEA